MAKTFNIWFARYDGGSRMVVILDPTSPGYPVILKFLRKSSISNQYWDVHVCRTHRTRKLFKYHVLDKFPFVWADHDAINCDEKQLFQAASRVYRYASRKALNSIHVPREDAQIKCSDFSRVLLNFYRLYWSKM